MRVKLTPNQYTQINTDPAKYLIQNISADPVRIIISDTQPAPTAPYDFIIETRCGISSSHVEGIVWGKCDKRLPATISVV